ncbi:aminopeptidase [Paramaledivibacter caminithermalis]|jgi:aspartyl aminopeptidase|uniref:M18 family aminopeptidase n=1 Tax=Paramaledivibacter caminithermalis (strain DSM 15212 / CIP 107654 / DViRD3) TaxID=1121301 RepID=A0A1M6MCM2_PARC5|nr:aminopeptidase [Paramaledivibacter caminithermalis]SHJ81185.1 Aspartyl aminopeptidase [Paramaledivibacter caminithermalis DSM 15212]
MNKEFKEDHERIMFCFQNAWEGLNEGEKKSIFSFADEYRDFLDNGKTERECVDEIVKIAKLKGFRNIQEIIKNNEEIKPGMKIYAHNKGKTALLLVVGQEKIEKGMNVVGTHIDSPRLDLKPFPLYEDGGLALLKTHYYGGIRKYQWTSLPLALHGVIFKKNGEKIDIIIGEEDNDPVFFITDLLPHLSKNQSEKKLEEGITGEGLNIVVGNIPLGDNDIKDKVKFNIMKILNDKYGIEEDDFTVAEIEVVPAGKARDVGLDRSLLSGYGHDDRVCSFAALKAILDIENPQRTCVSFFADKEEVGSQGNTGMESMFFENMISELIALQNKTYNELLLKRALSATRVLSGDVAAGFDPNYPDVHDKRNAAFIGKGVAIVKYTGSRGKSGCNDANAEFTAQVRKIFSDNNVVWQVGELGKVDQGGGGTIAYILANYGAEVIDCGTPVLSMHAPYELISKADLFMTFKGYKAFLKDA